MSNAKAYFSESMAILSAGQALLRDFLAGLRPEGDKAFSLPRASMHTNLGRAAQTAGINASSVRPSKHDHGRETADTTVISGNPGEAAEKIRIQRKLNMRCGAPTTVLTQSSVDRPRIAELVDHGGTVPGSGLQPISTSWNEANLSLVVGIKLLQMQVFSHGRSPGEDQIPWSLSGMCLSNAFVSVNTQKCGASHAT